MHALNNVNANLFVENDYLRLSTPVMDWVRKLRDDKNGRVIFLPKADTVITCEVLEAVAKKPRKEFAYNGIFDDVC